MLKEGSAETVLLPANPKRATVAAVNANVRMDMFFIFIIVRIRRNRFGAMGCSPHKVIPIGRDELDITKFPILGK